MLSFDPSQRSAEELAYRVSREVGLDIDSFTVQGGGLIALPFSIQYSHAGIFINATDHQIWDDNVAIEAGYTAGPFLHRPKDRTLACARRGRRDRDLRRDAGAPGTSSRCLATGR